MSALGSGLGVLGRLLVPVELVTTRFFAQLKGLQARIASTGTFNRLGAASTALAASLSGLRFEAIATGFALFRLTKLAADVETGFLAVQKTTNLEGEALDSLKRALERMSVTLAGVSLREIQNIATVAGQLGIRGEADILKFTEAIIKLSVTSDLSSEKAAVSIARILNVFKLTADQAGVVATVFTRLAAETTAMESEVAELTRRLSGAAATLGLTAFETAALGAALKDAGVFAEVGGTAFTQIMLGMIKKTKEFAAASQVSFEDFSEMIREEPIEALKAFVLQLGSLDKFSRIKVLDTLSIDGIRAAGTILQLSQSMGKFETALALANDEVEKQTALNREFGIFSQSTTNQLKRLGNALSLTSRKITDALLPEIKKLALFIQLRILPALGQWLDRNRNLIVDLLKGTAVVLGMALVLPILTRGIRILIVALQAARIAFLFLLANPWTALILAIGTALVVAFARGDTAAEKMLNTLKFLLFKLEQVNAAANIVFRGDSSLADKQIAAQKLEGQLQEVSDVEAAVFRALQAGNIGEDENAKLVDSIQELAAKFENVQAEFEGFSKILNFASKLGSENDPRVTNVFRNMGTELGGMVRRLDLLLGLLKQESELTEAQVKALEALKSLGDFGGEAGKPVFLGLEEAFKKVQLSISRGGDADQMQLDEQKKGTGLLTEIRSINRAILIQGRQPRIAIAG